MSIIQFGTKQRATDGIACLRDENEFSFMTEIKQMNTNRSQTRRSKKNTETLNEKNKSMKSDNNKQRKNDIKNGKE